MMKRIVLWAVLVMVGMCGVPCMGQGTYGMTEDEERAYIMKLQKRGTRMRELRKVISVNPNEEGVFATTVESPWQSDATFKWVQLFMAETQKNYYKVRVLEDRAKKRMVYVVSVPFYASFTDERYPDCAFSMTGSVVSRFTFDFRDGNFRVTNTDPKVDFKRYIVAPNGRRGEVANERGEAFMVTSMYVGGTVMRDSYGASVLQWLAELAYYLEEKTADDF